MRRWLVVLVGAALVAAACGGGGEESGDEIAQKVEDAIDQAGMVYHAIGDDNSEVWIDAEDQVFRRREATSNGELVSIGEGWERIIYDPFENQVFSDNANPQGPQRPRIDHPMVIWLEALGALAFGQELEVIGDTVADERAVLALEARTPVFEDGEFTGRTLIGRIELDPDTYLPLAFERSERAPAGATPSQDRIRIRYTTSELVPRADLPEGFFARSVVEDQVLTTEESLDQLRNLGLTPYWLGRGYESQLGQLELPPTDAVITDPTTTEAELHYALIVAVGQVGGAEPLLDTVILRLARDASGFVPPTFPELGGTLPEDVREVEARGVTATLYTSFLTPPDLGCGVDDCPQTNARLYRRLVLVLDDTAVQIEAFARVGPNGEDNNRYNSEFGLIALAETMMAATQEEEAA